MATALSLHATRRTVTGKHVHALRRGGEVPAILYGYNVQPTSLAIDTRVLEKVWHRAGRSHLVDLTLDGGSPRKVLIRELQIDPRTAHLLHADLFAVNLREKLTVEIPIVPVGDAPAVTDLKIGVLQQIMTTVKIECLPTDLPAQLTVDVSGLAAIDDGIHLSEVPLPQDVALAHGVDPEDLVVKISALRVIEEVEAVEAAPEEGEAAEAPAAGGAEAEAAGTE
ncbi:MAG: 50S ribosomal protein L25 [Chloroflexi bacterium]|nr:MAG: 50S ribosomal protein L25 [Chloroflexota bacterium]